MSAQKEGFQPSALRGARFARRLAGTGVLLAALLAAGGPARAQDGRTVYNEELRTRLDEQTPLAREKGLDAGGWLTFGLLSYRDRAASKDRTLREYDARLWSSLNYQGVHRGYVRGLLRFDDWNDGDNPEGGHDNQHDEVVERAWYQFDLGQEVQNRTGQPPPVAVRITVGRDFAEMGSALVLSMPLDLVRVEARSGPWELMGLAARTIRTSNNIDTSTEVYDRQERCLWGVQATYHGFDHHEPYVYFLSNRDHTDPEGNPVGQSFDYDSDYVGAGSRGTVLSPNLRYLLEIVGERGKTYSNGVTSGKDPIRAMALDAMLEYLFSSPTHPRVSAEYLFASGDSDRTQSATATVGGNRAGTTDHAFNAFGYRDTGVAFAPRLSNLHIYTAGAGFRPLEKSRLFRRMELGSKVFFYQKATDGPTSDTGSTRDSHWAGWEWDLYCDWRITSDLSFTVRYGAFFPGESFGDRGDGQFLYTAFTYSF